MWTVFVYFDKFCWRLFEIDPNFLKTSRKLMQMKRPDFNHYQTHMRLHSCFFPISGWFENVIPFDWDEAKRMWRESFKWNWIANALKWFRFSFHKKREENEQKTRTYQWLIKTKVVLDQSTGRASPSASFHLARRFSLFSLFCVCWIQFVQMVGWPLTVQWNDRLKSLVKIV